VPPLAQHRGLPIACAGTDEFARLEKALENMARRAWAQQPDWLAYLQAKLDRRVSDPASRLAAAELIDEWRRGSMVGDGEA
jgi:hypothetical protein